MLIKRKHATGDLNVSQNTREKERKTTKPVWVFWGKNVQLDGRHCRVTQRSTLQGCSRGRSRNLQNGMQAMANSCSSKVSWPWKAATINALLAFLMSWSWIRRANVPVCGDCFCIHLWFWGPDQCKRVCLHQTKHTLPGIGSRFLISLHSPSAAVGQHLQWTAI